jgi:hypothetical protein
MSIENKNIDDLIFDDKNYNRGTEKGSKLIEKSLKELGFGRSVLIDKDDRIIAGNKTIENAHKAGLKNVRVIETDGTEIIAVKRTDTSLDDKKGRELALVDNTANQLNFDLDVNNLMADFTQEEANEWGVNVNFDLNPDDLDDSFTLPSGDKPPFQQMTFTLADEQSEQIKNAIADIKQTQEYKYAETMGNENSNGNALYLIIMQWAEQRK